MSVRVLLSIKDEKWLARCLDHSVSVTGDTRAEVMAAVEKAFSGKKPKTAPADATLEPRWAKGLHLGEDDGFEWRADAQG